MRYGLLILLAGLFFTATLRAQSPDEAFRLYSEGRFAEAIPLFEQALLSNRKEIVKRHIEIYPILGEIYNSRYQFEKSAEAYSNYADLLKSNNQIQKADSVQHRIDQAKRAARMLSHCEDIQLIDSVIIDKKHFLNTYLLSEESGSLYQEDETIIYENPLHDKHFFSEKQAGGHYRLFSEIRLQDEWTDKKVLVLSNDSLSDNNFPFVLTDGLTLYFASTGKTSIGGYDLYVTRYNLNNDTWLSPNQLGMPFNSIYNDYLLAIDEMNHIGYFATDRFQTEDKVIVYTFIPNEEQTFIETDKEAERIRRAEIQSIQATWKPGTDYTAMLEQIRQSIRGDQSRPQHDFTFVIDDNRIYHSLIDFKKDAARQAFGKSQEIKKDIQQTEVELNNLRLEYFKAGTIQKQDLKTRILSNEEKLQTLYRQFTLFEKNARNFEIK
ncbi:hypothetical protein FACS189413_10020 [Bacteroidia bacterium]|nr:hypothetical protein FACS189413_10020 [Bacteroidia bacterium]